MSLLLLNIFNHLLVEPADMDPMGEGHWLHFYNVRSKISLITIELLISLK